MDPHDALVGIAERIAVGRDSPADWLNSNATQFFPDWGKDVDLKPLYPRDAIRVEGAPADALRAMKLRTAMSRPGRDTDDIVSLVAELDIESANYAESIFSASHPGDALKDRVYALVERAVAHRAEFQTTALPDVELIQGTLTLLCRQIVRHTGSVKTIERTLILLGHAKSDWSGSAPDIDRPLAERGRAKSSLVVE